MDENLLLDAIERYHNGQMTDEEKKYFEDLRKNNPDIDQVAVEHTYLLNELSEMSKIKALKHTISEVETQLENEGVLTGREKRTKAKIVYLWTRYRRTIAVAAVIAVVVSLGTASLMSRYSENKKVAVITPLVDNKLNQFEHKLNQIEHKLNDATALSVKPKFEANFRATGFLIDGSGYIVTNAHVVEKAKNLIVENRTGDQYYAKAVYSNAISDLAILKITDSSFKKVSGIPYTFPKTTSELAEPIYTLGYPREEVVYNQGYLSSKSGYYNDTTSYQISISVNPGNSGGPVIDSDGEVIGVISSKETNADGVVFAIKSKCIYTALDKIKDDKDITIKLPVKNTLKSLTRVKQIKKLEDFVYKIKGN